MITNRLALAAVVGVLLLGMAGKSQAVPSFARQTGMACQACHTVFPELTPFGRAFKLNGYQIDNLPQVQGITADREHALLLNQLPPLSLMVQTSYTKTKTALPDSCGTATTNDAPCTNGAVNGNAQNGQLLFPQQASLFYAGRIAPNLGAFVQITYDPAAGTIGMDNMELRYAKQVASVPMGLTYGVTMNNNPTVQDVWNSTPAWQVPFDQVSSVAPTPGAATQIDGVLGGKVAGLTAYVWWAKSIYAELGWYRSSPQGFTNKNGAGGPLDSTLGDGVVVGWAPYWRLAFEHQWDNNSLSVGMYGMDTTISPPGQAVGSPTNKFHDVALDAQYQFIGDDHIYSLQTTYIKERQTLDAAFAAAEAENATNELKTFRLGGSYYYKRLYGASLGVFSTKGTTDALLYPQGTPVTGFANGSPNSNGWVAEVSYMPWQNVKFLLQHVNYSKFNGDSTNYDGTGRNAKDNNTTYLLGWLNF